MTFRPTALAFLGLTLSIACWSPDDARAETTKTETSASRASLERTLAQLIAEHAESSGLSQDLRGYSLAPRLVQMRRYTEPGQKRVKLVCIVSLALKDPQSALVAEVTGNAAGFGASERDVLDAAARAAVMRVPTALARLRGDSPSEVARR